MFIPIADWFPAFLLTMAVEVPIVIVLVRGYERETPRLLILIAFANLGSHLAVWYVFSQLFLVGTIPYTVAAEAWAVAAETLFYWAAIRGLPWRRALAVAVLANLASFLVGELVGLVLSSRLA